MAVKVRPEDLDEEIREILEEYSAAVIRTVNEGLEEVADYTAKALKQGGPYKERSGKYSKDWTYKRMGHTPGIFTEEFKVYNKKHYRLTHLLEKGHVSRSGKRVKAFSHIEPAMELAQQMAISKIGEAIRQVGGK